MNEIFISYRREDTPSARLLYYNLENIFGKERIFWDLQNIPPGENFVKAIEAAVKSCRIVLAIVGPAWNSLDETGQRELMKDTDFVRFELIQAIRDGKPIIPALVQSASMPAPEDLPRRLKDFAHFNAIELSDSRWDYDVKQLTDAVHKLAKIELKLQPKLSESQFKPHQTFRSPSLSRLESLKKAHPSVVGVGAIKMLEKARHMEWEKSMQEYNENRPKY